MRRLQWSPDGALLVAALEVGSVQVLDGASGGRQRTLSAPDNGIACAAVALPASDRTVRSWDARARFRHRPP